MRNVAALLAVVSIAALLDGCAGQAAAPAAQATSGEPGPAGSVYTSRLGNFTCKVPPLATPGARLTDHGDADSADVSFSDDFGRMLRIDSVRLPPDAAANIDAAALDRLFDQSVFPDLFLATSPKAETLRREHVTAAAGPALFAVVRIPEGSNLVADDGGGTRKRLDSVRGVLVTVQHGFAYVIMDQEWPVGGVDRGPLPQRCDRLRGDLQDAVAGMTFLDR